MTGKKTALLNLSAALDLLEALEDDESNRTNDKSEDEAEAESDELFNEEEESGANERHLDGLDKENDGCEENEEAAEEGRGEDVDDTDNEWQLLCSASEAGSQAAEMVDIYV